MSTKLLHRSRQLTALALAWLMTVSSAYAGITMTGADGITMTGADGITMTGADGITMTGADGITMTGADGITMTGADGITMTGADGITMTGADGITMTGADGITMTGADGITLTGADGTRYTADSVLVRQPNGITMTGADALRVIDPDGTTMAGADGITMTGADGITMTGADGITLTGADGIVATTPTGNTFSVRPDGVTMTGADAIAVTGPVSVAMSGVNGLVMPPAEAAGARTGLQSIDLELALKLNNIADDSTINCVIVYHHLPTDADLGDLQRLGFVGGTRFRVLPAVIVTGTRDQLVAVSHLPAVRSIYGNRTLQLTADPGRGLTGVERARQDVDLTTKNAGLPYTGRGVTVAVLDTGVDGTHNDLAGRVVQNVKLADTQSANVGFNYPLDVENVPTTDQAYGHGTFVAGVIAGDGTRSGGAYTGIAPGARVLGLGAGDVSLFYILDGFDYLLQHASGLNVRVVNCSFSAETIYDTNDPVNVATKMLTERGVNVVVSAGNTGPGMHTLNPYAVAPWVVSVGATDYKGKLASFSSRGQFASGLFRPTLVAPGVGVTSLRATGINQTSAEGVALNGDAQNIPPALLPYYTTASGTSFSAPQVAGAIALMLEANPHLTPVQVRDILARTATPMPAYYAHEVGAGMLNTHAAVLDAAFPQRHLGAFRATLNRGQVRFVSDPLQQVRGTVQPGTAAAATVNVPQNALFAAMQIGWSSLSVNDLGFSLYDATSTKQADVNTVNLPGLTGKRERVLVNFPAAGAWRVRVGNTLGVAGTPQPFVGVLETGHAEYAPLRDLGNVDGATRADILQALRTFVMQPVGANFRPAAAVSRADLAAALVLAGRAPQYLPAQPTYSDVRDPQTMLFVESAQRAPGGAFFPDAGARKFVPDVAVDRVTAAVVLVRAGGWEAEAMSNNTPLVGILDVNLINDRWRSYVAVALKHGLLATSELNFRPQAGLTRAELAHALVVMQNSATQ